MQTKDNFDENFPSPLKFEALIFQTNVVLNLAKKEAPLIYTVYQQDISSKDTE